MGVTALLIAGTAISAGGAIASGVAQRQSAQFQAAVAKQNASLARQRAALDEDRVRRQDRRLLGTIKARGAAQAGDFPLDLIADAASEIELDALLTRFGGELGSRDALNRAAAARASGQAALAGGIISAGGSLLTGFGQRRLAQDQLDFFRQAGSR